MDPKEKLMSVFEDSAAMPGNELAFQEALDALIEHILEHPEDY